jgi:hypothetical protein
MEYTEEEFETLKTEFINAYKTLLSVFGGKGEVDGIIESNCLKRELNDYLEEDSLLNAEIFLSFYYLCEETFEMIKQDENERQQN